jgi:lipopolysaccharide heptosyltransferase II
LTHVKLFFVNRVFSISLQQENIRRILVIKLRAIGDVLLSTPVVQNLHEYFPNARIDFLTDEFAADVVVGNPWISEVLTFDRKNDSSIGIIRKVRGKRYDLIIDLFSNPRSAIITGLSGAPVRVGFPFRWRKYLYNVIITPRNGNIHNVDFNLDALRRIDVPVRHLNPYFPLNDSAKKFADEWINGQHLDGRTIVGLNPGGGWTTKRWGLEHYARLGDVISERHNAAIVVLWGPGEEQDAIFVREKMKSQSYVIPRTSLSELGGIIGRCAFVVSNDSGPMHIAAALNVATLGIFGPTNPLQQGPYGEGHRWVRNEGLDCLECSLTTCPIGNICMTQLSVERVMDVFDELHAQTARKQPAFDHQRKE